MHLAQVNIGKMVAPIDSPMMRGFVDNLDLINNLAESSNGFVWRLKEESNNATSIRIFDDDFLIINLTVWKNIESLYEFVYRSDHSRFLKRRSEWFERMSDMHMAMWYIEEGLHPTVDEALERLVYLRRSGESDHAFTFKYHK